LQAVFLGISRRKLLDPGKNAGVNNDMNCVTPIYNNYFFSFVKSSAIKLTGLHPSRVSDNKEIKVNG
jgi:hypothetical protein